ncbi:MAG TPA: monofunctional biosynthetic peptidoglycan transglycosylase [Burkholderiaceae bacterium]|nr:monofunctional biosynthetic peptidoglycan transglycosylase [Burkholderiaceae bacterium]
MRTLARGLALLLVALASLQIFLVARVALMRWVDPQSTTFQRSEWWRLQHERGARFAWRQQWVDGGQIAESLKRAVIASEDAGFVEHSGVEWDAIERAWERNQRRQAIDERRAAKPGARQRPVKLVCGSTITQQLAKNLFLSGERTLARKAQEFMLTWTLEALLSKRRILEIYLNSVEWGEGVFGAQAAAQHYHRVDATRLGPQAAAHLAVLLPAPKRFERHPGSAYVSGRAATIAARMDDVELP